MILWRKNKDDLQNQIARMTQQADQLSENGRYKDAVNIVTQLCKMIKRNFGENNSDYANSLNNLGLMYYYMGDYSKAEPLYKNALEIRGKVLGENDSDYAASLQNLALLYSDIGYYSKAEPLYQRATRI